MPENTSRHIRFLMSPLQKGRLLAAFPEIEQFLKWLVEIPGVDPAILVLPDASPCKWGVPTGFVVRTRQPEATVLPTAVADSGCGYRVLLVRFEKQDIGLRDTLRLAKLIDDFVGPNSQHRRSLAEQVDMERVFTEGMRGLPEWDVADSDGLLPDWIGPTAAPPDINLIPGLDRMVHWARKCFGRYAAHFFSMRRVTRVFAKPDGRSPSLACGDYVIIIHSGAMLVRECVKQRQFYEIARSHPRGRHHRFACRCWPLAAVRRPHVIL
jgi:hypothetical protein